MITNKMLKINKKKKEKKDKEIKINNMIEDNFNEYIKRKEKYKKKEKEEK